MDDSDQTVTITVTRSAGTDGAFVVLVDTTFEPDGSDGSAGLRIHVNDGTVFRGVEFDYDDATDDRPAVSKSFEVKLSDVPYVEEGISS